MSILSEIAAAAAKKVGAVAAEHAAYAVADKVGKGIDRREAKKKAKEEERLAKLKAEHPDLIRLILVHERGKFKESYSVYDSSRKNKKYIVKGERLSRKHHLHLFTADGQTELGMVKEKLFAFRNPFSFEVDPKNFELVVGGSVLGKMKSKSTMGKKRFYFDFNDWIIEGNFISTTYQIKSGDTVLMVVKDKIGTMATDPYYVDIMDQKNELLCLLVAIAIDAAKSTKSEEMKFARKQLKKRIDPFDTPYD